ncbi:MAG: glyoxalase [Rhodobacteraceae bacterium]|jgi:predicted enzyme related to lactoylglutathione lyase|nr:glyoxalase [Paracoccaceae bacterium]MBT5854026.1 glyoxalase [Paracoccaceae bacterium]
MDYNSISTEEFSEPLIGLGVNIIVKSPEQTAQFLEAVFGLYPNQLSADFALILYQGDIFQLHSDKSFTAHPSYPHLPENPPRGTGIELRLYKGDPDQACTKAQAYGCMVLAPATEKPHGLREATILCPDGYMWVPSRPLA